MKVTPISLSFPYQYTDAQQTYKVLWVTDKGYITLDTPFYAIEPSETDDINVPYIAPFWTNLVYVTETTIKPVIYNGLFNQTSMLEKLNQTVSTLNLSAISDEANIYRTVMIQWENLITQIDNSSNLTRVNNAGITFAAYLFNGPSTGYKSWNSYLRFEYNVSASVKSPDYQPVIIGYHTSNTTSHNTNVSFSDKITSVIGSNGSTARTYFLSSKRLSSCEQWYWKEYTEIQFGRSPNLTNVKRNPCPCSYDQATSDFRFYKMNSENSVERANNIACFVPLSTFVQRTSSVTTYQQTCCYDTNTKSLVTSGEFAGSVIDEKTFETLRYSAGQRQRIEERDLCCISSTAGTTDWSNGCHLYYEIRPASTCQGYEPPLQAWFGGDPHMETLTNVNYSCNVFGSFIYAQTNAAANATASVSGTNLAPDELFSIVATTAKTQSPFTLAGFVNQTITYYTSFSMYLGSNREVSIDVRIDPNNTSQFAVSYFFYGISNNATNPFPSGTNFNNYFYYPTVNSNSAPIAFTIAQDNETITAIDWSTKTTTNFQVSELTITVWSGLAMQCYMVTNNMACTLLLPKKYNNFVEGIAVGLEINATTTDAEANNYCNKSTLNNTTSEVIALDRNKIQTWYTSKASQDFIAFINNVACPSNILSASTQTFCLQDQLLSQSALLAQLTTLSSSNYQLANRQLANNPPSVTLVQPLSPQAPYTYLLSIKNTQSAPNNAYIPVNVQPVTSIVQIRSTNNGSVQTCSIQSDSTFHCSFNYSSTNNNNIQITIIANDPITNLSNYQSIQLIVDACVDGNSVWNNQNIISSSISILGCVCNDFATGDFCDKTLTCNDINACQLNFAANVNCELNLNSTNTTRALYTCYNASTNVSCANDSCCINSRYTFQADVQQCLFQPVCTNQTSFCGNGICQNSEYSPSGYICICDGTTIFNGETCVEKDVCHAPQSNNNILPCSGPFEEGNNENGTCTCLCREGTIKNSTGCYVTANIACNDPTGVCNYTIGTLLNQTFCKYPTQFFNNNTNKCEDIDYCSTYCLNGICTNYTGGYSCLCSPGTSLDYAFNCVPCAKGSAGPNCSYTCNCEFGVCQAQAANESTLCNCSNGYRGPTCNEVILFCDDDVRDVCNVSVPDSHKVCTNAPTNHDLSTNEEGFVCSCESGFTEDTKRNCIDIDECNSTSSGDACPSETTTCYNTIGSYLCICKPGYTKNTNDTGACVDVNECALGIDNCASINNSICVNLVPSFECRCAYGYSPGGAIDQIYAAIKPGDNKTCEVYDQCAAVQIDCGSAKCNSLTQRCYCESPLTLVTLSPSRYDCACENGSLTFNGSTCVSRPTGIPSLSGATQFTITLSCSEATALATNFNNSLATRFNYSFEYILNMSSLGCDEEGNTEITLSVLTNNNVTTLNGLYAALENLANSFGGTLEAIGPCGNTAIVVVQNVTSCYLINQCNLCGNPPLGICDPATGLSVCKCFVNSNYSLQIYNNEFCYPTSLTTTEKPVGTSVSWTPIVVGVLAGVAGLFCIITCCLLGIVLWRRRHPRDTDDLRIRRIWHLPRAQPPTTVTAQNVETYLNSQASNSTTSSIPEDSMTSSDRSTYRTNYDLDVNGTVNSNFFRQLDQTMGAKLRATVIRPDIHAVLSSLPAVTTTTLSTNTSSNDDPINDLDDIIDDDDITMTFHDPLDDLFEDNEILEVLNPNLKLPRPHLDSQPTGLFSFFNQRF